MKAIHVASAYLTIPLLVIGLAGCVPKAAPPAASPSPAVPPSPATRPAPVPRPMPPASADWRDAPQSPGTWRWAMEGGRSVARYGPGAETLASLSCLPGSGTTILWRSGPAGPNPLLTVTTTRTRRMVTATAQAGGGVAARLAARDSLLDAMVFSRGRFMLETPGAAPLYLPAWPEFSRVIEDCR